MSNFTNEGELEETEFEKWMNKHEFNENIKKNLINNKLTIELLENIELQGLKDICKEWNLKISETNKFIAAVKLLPNSISKKENKKIIILNEKTQLFIDKIKNEINNCKLNIQNNKKITESLLFLF